MRTLGEIGEVARINGLESGVQARPDTGALQRRPVSLCGDGKPIRDTQAHRRQLAIELSKGGIFPPDKRNVVEPDVAEEPDELIA